VTVNIARGPRVVIAFSGDPLPPNERERLVPVREEGAADEDLLEDAARNIEGYFFARGYRDATVEFTQVEKDGELVITFDVERGPRFLVNEITITGNTAFSTMQLRELLQLGPGDLFVDAVLDAGVAAMRNQYRASGFTQTGIKRNDAVLPPEDPADPDRAVDIAVAIAEGPRTLVRSVAFSGNMAVTEAELRLTITLAPGTPYAEADVATAREVLELEYRNRGYDTVSVTADTTRADGETQADVAFRIIEGPQSIVDHVIILGNERTSPDTIRRELRLVEGRPLGYADIIESRGQLMALGLFSGVQIEPAPQVGPSGRRDVIVRVQEAPANTFGFGGGLEGASRLRQDELGQAEERFEIAPRGFIEIGRRNLWGKNRSVNLFTRVSLRSREIAITDQGVALERPTDRVGFNEYRVIGTFREPRLVGSSAELLVTGILEQGIRSSFNFGRRIVRAEAGMGLSQRFSAAARYSFERTELFDEKFQQDDDPVLIDRLFPQIRLSKIAGSLIHDTRDDPADSSRGTLLIVDGDLAARSLGSEVGFVKTYIQGFTFHRLPTQRRIVAAFAGRLGAAHGFAREVTRTTADGAQVVDVIQDLPASERFFAGGDTSVRGFSLDRLGNENTISATGFPTGGNSVIVLSSELRVTTFSPLQVVGFLDAGNVYPRAGDLDLTDLRPAAGLGLRYRSPVGPIRFDLGFNLDPRELVPGRPERRTVFHISLGQAF
jgi:outer membrane protein assembly complex protein YaeT